MTSTDDRDLDLVRRSARELARRFDLGYWREKDKKGEYPWEFVKAFADGGWLGAMIPEEYGGLGLGLTESAIMMSEVAASGAGMSGASAIHFYVFPPAPILRHGSEEMKRAYLPKLARGEILMAFGVTEPTAGVDTSRIRTRAEKIPGGRAPAGRRVDPAGSGGAHGHEGRSALRRQAVVRQGIERGQVPRGRGGLPGVRPGDADPRGVRLREGVPHRAAVA
jgi:acyl-CoA dehydrogenase